MSCIDTGIEFCRIGVCAILIFLVLPVLHSCRDTGPEPPLEIQVGTKPFGSDGRIPAPMVVDGRYLYVCAGPFGLWRRETSRNFTWRYLGLADTARLSPGVEDVSVNGPDMLVAYNGMHAGVNVDSLAGLSRSSDSGTHWTPTATGVVYVAGAISRSPHDVNRVLALWGTAFFLSSDGGIHWSSRGDDHNGGGMIRWNPNHAGEVWTFGHTNIDYPYLLILSEFGETTRMEVKVNTMLGINDAYLQNVFDIAFDLTNPEAVIAATSKGVFLSVDSGNRWDHLINGEASIGWITGILADPLKPGRFLVTSFSNGVFWSDSLLAGGSSSVSFNPLFQRSTGDIYSMAIDTLNRQLFIGTSEDVFAIDLPP
jgi:hypothetical protein